MASISSSINVKLSSSFKPNLIIRFPTSKFGFPSSNMNIKLVKTSAFRSGGSREKSVKKMFPNDAFAKDSSSSFHSEFMAPQLQATVDSLSKWVVSGIFIVVLVWKHDAESLWAAIGSVLNHMFCVTLKRILKQERPVSALKSDPGMPSSHAQSIFYILLFSILSVYGRLGVHEFTLAITALAFAFGSILCWLRVSQQFHTPNQVIVGGTIGSMFSIMWYWSWHSFVFEAFTSFWWVRAMVLSGAASYVFCFLLYFFQCFFTHKS